MRFSGEKGDRSPRTIFALVERSDVHAPLAIITSAEFEGVRRGGWHACIHEWEKPRQNRTRYYAMVLQNPFTIAKVSSMASDSHENV